MAITTVFRPIGPTTAITTSTTSSTAVTISASGNNQMDFCAFLNTGSTPISINIVPVVDGVGSAGAAVFPNSTPNTNIVLGINMQQPMVVAVPQVFSLTALGTASGTLYVTPVDNQ